MSHQTLDDTDLAQIERHELTASEIERQLELFEHPPAPTTLDRPCLPGDGIRVLSQEEIEACIRAHEDARARGRLQRFTPASGAATRMFKALLAVRNRPDGGTRANLQQSAQDGDLDAKATLAFLDSLPRFAFYEALRQAMVRFALEPGPLWAQGRGQEILDFLLTRKGLDYAALPKGLILFHNAADRPRTAIEEQLLEGAQHVRDRTGTCRFHFTVSPEHLAGFQRAVDDARARHEARLNIKLEVSFSTQKPGTDTIAVDGQNRPFRDGNGRLVFRPGGHGALIENLNDLQGDIVFIKNIDNVVPDALTELTLRWKRALGGLLVATQQRTFRLLASLVEEPGNERLVREGFQLLQRDFSLAPPPGLRDAPLGAQSEFVLQTLDRPIRICGMIASGSNPGGGPFWVRGKDGRLTRQIVESAEVDAESAEQQQVLMSATHFNPVDLVCGMRNFRGQPYDLRRYVDPETVFITEKSVDGQAIKALERPGLWNGGMAHWNTVFVEVPGITFNPVKTVNDLLRPEHQGKGS